MSNFFKNLEIDISTHDDYYKVKVYYKGADPDNGFVNTFNKNKENPTRIFLDLGKYFIENDLDIIEYTKKMNSLFEEDIK